MEHFSCSTVEHGPAASTRTHYLVHCRERMPHTSTHVNGLNSTGRISWAHSRRFPPPLQLGRRRGERPTGGKQLLRFTPRNCLFFRENNCFFLIIIEKCRDLYMTEISVVHIALVLHIFTKEG